MTGLAAQRKAFHQGECDAQSAPALSLGHLSDQVGQALTIARLRRALQKIADLPLEDHPNNAGRSNPRLRARRIAVAALRHGIDQ